MSSPSRMRTRTSRARANSPRGRRRANAELPIEAPMLTRRRFVAGTLAGGLLSRAGASLAKASQPATPVNFEVPPGACDCHTHIHGDPVRFPYFSGRVYTPETAMPEEMAELHRALRMRRVVIVTPSVYGTDNSATLWGMKARGADARGVAVIDADEHEPGRGRCDQGPRRRLARSGGVRSFRQRAGRAWRATAGLFRSRGAGPLGQGLRQDLGLGRPAAGLRRLRAPRQSADCREPQPHRLGDELAASEFRLRAQADRADAAVPSRRRPGVEPAAGVGARR